MDPNACIQIIVAAVRDARAPGARDRDARDAINDLAEWLDGGGFVPSPNLPELAELAGSPSKTTAAAYNRLRNRIARLTRGESGRADNRPSPRSAWA